MEENWKRQVLQRLETSAQTWEKDFPGEKEGQLFRLGMDMTRAALQSARLSQPESPGKRGPGITGPALRIGIMALAAFLTADMGRPAAALAVLAAGAVCLLLPGMRRTPEQPLPEVRFEGGLPEELKECIFRAAAEEPEPQPRREACPLTRDVNFARWVQMFALYAHRTENGNLLQQLRLLKQLLEEEGLYVYDELVTDQQGNAVLPPDEDAYMDLREGENWTKVTLPAVYTDSQVLMHGQIR